MDKEDDQRHNAFRRDGNRQSEVFMNYYIEQNIKSSKKAAKNRITGTGQARQRTSGQKKEKQKSKKANQGESDETVVKIFNRNKRKREKAKLGKRVRGINELSIAYINIQGKLWTERATIKKQIGNSSWDIICFWKHTKGKKLS